MSVISELDPTQQAWDRAHRLESMAEERNQQSLVREQWSKALLRGAAFLFGCALVAAVVMFWTLNRTLPEPMSAAELRAYGERR